MISALPWINWPALRELIRRDLEEARHGVVIVPTEINASEEMENEDHEQTL